MKRLKLTEATASLAEYTRALNQEPLVVTERGKPVAVLVPVAGLDLEALSVGTDPKFLDLIERSRRRQRDEGGIPDQELRPRLGLKPTVSRSAKPNGRKKTRKTGQGGDRDGGQV